MLKLETLEFPPTPVLSAPGAAGASSPRPGGATPARVAWPYWLGAASGGVYAAAYLAVVVALLAGSIPVAAIASLVWLATHATLGAAWLGMRRHGHGSRYAAMGSFAIVGLAVVVAIDPARMGNPAMSAVTCGALVCFFLGHAAVRDVPSVRRCALTSAIATGAMLLVPWLGAAGHIVQVVMGLVGFVSTLTFGVALAQRLPALRRV